MVSYSFSQPWLSMLYGPDAPNAQEWAHLRDYLKGIDSGAIPLFNPHFQNMTLDNSSFLLLTGGTMSGAIAMGSNKITGLANGTATSDAAAFGQIKYLSTPALTVATTNFATTANTYQTTNLSASITPSSASSRIKITAFGSGSVAATNGTSAYFSIFRGSTNLATGANAGFGRVRSSGTIVLSTVSLVFIDSPATTSSTTYAVKIMNDDNVTTVQFGAGDDQVMILEEIR